MVDERTVLRDALTRSMGEMTHRTIRADFEQRVEAGEFIQVEQRAGTPGRAFTTREMIALERETIDRMRAGQHTQSALWTVTKRDIEQTYPRLNEHQVAAVTQILASRDKMVALEGVAGGGKTTTLAVVRDAV